MKIYRYNLNKWRHNNLVCEEFDVGHIDSPHRGTKEIIQLYITGNYVAYHMDLKEINNYYLKKLNLVEMKKLKNYLMKSLWS